MDKKNTRLYHVSYDGSGGAKDLEFDGFCAIANFLHSLQQKTFLFLRTDQPFVMKLGLRVHELWTAFGTFECVCVSFEWLVSVCVFVVHNNWWWVLRAVHYVRVHCC